MEMPYSLAPQYPNEGSHSLTIASRFGYDKFAAMPKPDLPNFSLPMRIGVGLIAIWLIYWLLKTTGTI